MRTDTIYMVFLLWIFLFVGCSDNGGGQEGDEDDFITINSCIINNQLFEDGEFNIGDEIGIYVVPYNNDEPGDIESDAYAENVRLIYNGVSWLTSSGNKISWPPGQGSVDIYGYFPYDESLAGANPHEYDFTIIPDQRNEDNFENSDFLWAIEDNITPSSAPVGLTFSHRLSKVNINITSTVPEVSELLEDATVSITNVLITTTIDLEDGMTIIPGKGPLSTVYPKTTEVPLNGYERSLEGIIVPQTISAGTQFISIFVNDLYYYYRPSQAVVFPQGTTINFNITITQIGLSVATEIIEDWIPGGDISGNVGTPAPKIVDLSGIDWKTTRIYRVFDDGVPVAEVAKEYLYLSGQVDNQAIVVYPYSVDGVLDLTNGFVAQLMNRTINSTIDDYEPLTTSVHGGNVSFDPETNRLTSYTAGTQELITKVEIESSTSVVAASSTDVSFLSLEPYTVNDIDGNIYPLVKIATQYWMAKNLTVEHFRDGSDLPYYYYNNILTNKEIFGAYYNWTTMSDSRGICPEGWHVPSRPELNLMVTTYLGGTSGSGRKLKANQYWSNLNNGDNVTGFSLLPAGRRTDVGTYTEAYNYGQIWQTGQENANNGLRMYLDSGNPNVNLSALGKNFTQSIRCLRD